MSRTIHHVLCLWSLPCENHRVGLKGILVEQDSEVHVVSVRPELIRDVRNMMTGFLKNNRMKLTTGSGDNVGRISARRAWIPLKNRETVLMMHETACRLCQCDQDCLTWVAQN